MAGKLAVFEGIDGSGKQTQIALLAKTLVEREIKFRMFKYPTAGAKKIHAYLADGKKPADEDEVFGWYLEDIEKGQPQVADALETGWAVLDRYFISTAAYQGVGGKLEGRIERIDSAGLLKPDHVVWLDLEVGEAMRRKATQKKPDAHESDKGLLAEVSANYGKMMQMGWPCGAWSRIDAGAPEEEVSAAVLQALGL